MKRKINSQVVSAAKNQEIPSKKNKNEEVKDMERYCSQEYKIFSYSDYVKRDMWRVSSNDLLIMYSTLVFAVYKTRKSLKLNIGESGEQSIKDFFSSDKNHFRIYKSYHIGQRDFEYRMLYEYVFRMQAFPILREGARDLSIGDINELPLVEILNKLKKNFSQEVYKNHLTSDGSLVSRTYAFSDYDAYVRANFVVDNSSYIQNNPSL